MTGQESQGNPPHDERRRTPHRLAIGVVGSLATVVLLLAAAGTVFGAKPAPVPPQSFGVTGLATNAAGTIQTIKVSALIAGRVNAGYRGTVVLTSTDGQAVLPSAYQFTSADKGVHSFSVQLKTAGARTITASDASNSAIKGSQTATVTPAAAATFSLSSLSTVTAGTAQNLTLTVRDTYNNLATTYRGTVHALSSDGQAALPANYSFTAADAGAHTFSVTLKTVGQQAVSLSDTANGSLMATAGPVSVTPASAASLVLAELDDHLAGETQSVSVTALDAYGNVATGYRGTVAFSSSDAQATLPATHTFTAGDAGSRHFNVTPKTAASVTMTVTDTGNTSLTSSQNAAIANGPAADLAITTDVVESFQGQPLVTVGVPFSITIRVVDAYGNTAVDYVGTITFGSDEPSVFGQPIYTHYLFRAADAGSRTFAGNVLHLKRIYSEHTTFSASVANNGALAASLDFQVLPGAAVRFSACRPAYSQSSNYQQLHAPIGVNDAIGFYFDALDAYGNVATNRQPANPFLPALPTGYEATAAVVTSDPQANFFNRGAIAFFSGSRNIIGPQIEVALRTAGNQDITITDPINPALITTCTYEVKGPRAFVGTLKIADPATTGNPLNEFTAFTYLPPNDSGYTITDISAPLVDGNGGLVPLGTATAGADAGRPTVFWDLSPAAPPAGIATCDTSLPCVVTGPRELTYTLRDAYGNESTGSIIVELWTTKIASIGTVFFTQIDAQITVDIGGTPTRVDTSIQATVGATADGKTHLALEGIGNLDVLTPTGSSLTSGDTVTVILQKIVVGGNVPTCVPAPDKPCETGGFVKVTIIDGDPDDPPPDNTALVGYQTMGTDTCGFFDENFGNDICPAVFINGLPPANGTVGTALPTFQFEGGSTIDEPITWRHQGPLPTGVTFSNGILSGTPTQAGIFVYNVSATGGVSGAYRTYTYWLGVQPEGWTPG